MTITKAESNELFGSPSMWDLYLIRQPRTIFEALQIFAEEPRVSKSITIAIRKLNEEKRGKRKPPTLCLLCDNNFLKTLPSIIAMMIPSFKQTNGATFFLCQQCSAAKNDEVFEKVQAKLKKGLGANFSVHWGNA